MDKLYIKNMVCDRCIMVVKQELDKLNFEVRNVTLGEVTLARPSNPLQVANLQARLLVLGFELMDDKKLQLVQKIKRTIIDLVHRKETTTSISNFSDYLSVQLGKDYSFLSGLFSESEDSTIEQYVIHQKIERAKELLTYNERNISEIADELDYSSVSHLSNQFKKITGMSPSQFKALTDKTRLPLDKV